MPKFPDVFEVYVNHKKKQELTDGGTEAFPDLGAHCQHPDCNQLDFLPFSCDRCRKTFCLEHRTYKTHECTKPDEKNRKMFVCEICSSAIETTGKSQADEMAIIEKHQKSKDCDAAKKKKPRCPAHRCRQTLTFSNNVVCKSCNTKFCLSHRFPATHDCKRGVSAVAAPAIGGSNNKFLAAFAKRNGKDCAKNGHGSNSSTTSSRSIESC